MAAENQYTDIKLQALKAEVVTEETVTKMENDVSERFTETNEKTVVQAKESPFTQERKASHKSTGLSM